MPITPLHLGILAPINHWFPKKVSNAAFIWVTLWLDANAIAYYALGMQLDEFHSPNTHSFIAAFALGGAVGLLGFMYYVFKYLKDNGNYEGKATAWVLGAYLGAGSHILLDAMVHSEMLPFHPLPGNPFYWGGMEPVSFILVPFFIWFIVQIVSGTVSRLQRIRGDWRLRKY